MNKKIILITIAVLVAVATLPLSRGFLLSALAQKNSLMNILKFDAAAPQNIGGSTHDFTNSISVDKEQVTENDDVIDKARKLIEKAEKEYLVEGWLHISSQKETFAGIQNTLPDGSSAPTKWINDLWVLLDDKGNATKAVNIQDTGDPNTLQVSVFKDGLWTNTTLNIVSPEPETYHPTLDGGFFNSAIPYKDIKLSAEKSTVAGQNVIVFTTEERLKKPVKLGKDSGDKKAKEIYGSVYKFYFAEDSGLLIQTEDYTINSDNSLQISQRISIMVVEKISIPPETILDYFAK